ncbi:L-glyceraldehyde 3-phosphate reductase [Spartobacteria bacterium LR76]|nr:L-glyceraldehyde 3-phosphate reductase [Spartobacteria bacterium LR76]
MSLPHLPAPDRYDAMLYRRCGRSGLKLPALSLGLWHNFGGVDTLENASQIILRAFDLGVTHFDLANNYGPPPGSAEETFGSVLHGQLAAHRDELIISTKAGYRMWPGPYGEWGSRKYLLSSLDQSLKRMRLDYVDIFYHHRPDPDTPIEESLGALVQAVRSGRALYAGVSNYPAPLAAQAADYLREEKVPLLIHQPSYSMLNRWIEDGLTAVLEEKGVGCIPFSPLAQGLLTNRYLGGIPADSRAARPTGFLQSSAVTEEKIALIRKLNDLAVERGQTLAQMAVAWILRLPVVTSVLVGASRVAQLEDTVAALQKLEFSADELARIETILREPH